MKKAESIAHLIDRIARLENALTPFAVFGARLLDGRRGVPVKGDWHGLDTGAQTEASITIENFREAMQLLEIKPAVRLKVHEFVQKEKGGVLCAICGQPWDHFAHTLGAVRKVVRAEIKRHHRRRKG